MKSRRHFAIKDILANERIGTQEELCEALKERNYNVTQATVSRDIKELCLIKIPDGTGYKYAFPETPGMKNSHERMKRVFQELVVTIDYSENIIVIKTIPGSAQSIAFHIDHSMDNPNILGNVAGDDTIFVVVKPKEAIEEVLHIFTDFVS